MDQALQIVGALLILAAFVASQLGALATTSVLYLTLNFVGSLILAVLAKMGRQWGFLLLEGAWALVSLFSLVQRARGRKPAGTTS